MIYGKRIRFRAIERTDLPLFVDWINDPEVQAGLSMHLSMSLAIEENWFEDMLKRPRDEQPLGIEFQDKKDWTLIGNCGFFNIEPIHRSAEVGIMIGEKSYWNQGLGTEAMQLLLKHGFETLNLNRIYLRVFESNPRAMRAYEKSGYVLEGRQREAYYQDGKYTDVANMSVLRSEWNKSDQSKTE